MAAPKSICFIHYGIGWADGINTVLKTFATAIKKQKPSLKIFFLGGEIKSRILNKASYKTISELLPGKSGDPKIIAKKIAQATKGIDIIVIENPFLGDYHPSAMAGFSLYARQYKPKNTKLFFRIHDLYTDTPHYSKKLKKLFSARQIKNIVKGDGVDRFLIINRGLKDRLIKLGVSSHKIFYLPNGIDSKVFNKASKEKEKILLYPVRVVPRKNIEEAILLVYFIRKTTQENYKLLITGKVDKNDSLSRAYFKKLKELAFLAKIPVIFNKKPYPIEKIGELYSNSEAVVMTSLREGFGYPFLECWFSKKIVIGRRIQNVINDFEKSGLKFDWLYQDFLLQKKKVIFNEEKFERIEIIKKILKSNELQWQVFELNKKAIMEQVIMLQDEKKQSEIIKLNLKKVRESYEISQVIKRFIKILRIS